MPDKLEVLPGPGLVARFGEVALWAGPQATSTLQAHLILEAQRTVQAPGAGDELANSLIAVLQRGDPEPQAPFAVVGPGANGLTLFLHGPVQAWDSGRWLAPQPVPGWMVTAIGRPWPLIILPYGAPPPPQSQPGNPFDLLSGSVPGSGFILLRPPAGPAGPAQGPPSRAASSSPSTVGNPSTGPGSPPMGSPLGAPFGPPAGTSFGPPMASSTSVPAISPASSAPSVPGPLDLPSSPSPAGSQLGPGPVGGALTASTQVAGAMASAPLAAPPGQGPGGPIDLRLAGTRGGPPLPLAGARPPRTDRPEVVGPVCARGHLNHPRATTCARCGNPFPVGYHQASGPRPPVGILLADDGSIWSLDGGCLIGTDPSQAPDAQRGLTLIAMRPGSNHTMAPVQAEVQVRGWDAYLVDRGADGGTCIQGPAAEGWSQLSRHEQRELTSGSHVSCGGRVLTYLSAWPS